MLRTILFIIIIFFNLIIISPKLLYLSILDKLGKKEMYNIFLNKSVKKWANLCIKLSGSKVNVYGEENLPDNQTFLFISNHQSAFDIPLILAYIKTQIGFIAKIETNKIPLVNLWMKKMNCIFMDRKNIRQSALAISQGIKYLKEGQSIIIFPEGTRSKGDTISDFKAGSFKLAIKSGVPIVPITIKGSYKIYEENKNRIKPANVDIIISKPVYLDNLSKEELATLPDKIKSIIELNLNS